MGESAKQDTFRFWLDVVASPISDGAASTDFEGDSLDLKEKAYLRTSMCNG
jgi:hypothetical protein